MVPGGNVSLGETTTRGDGSTERTLKGNNIGNQLSMSFEMYCIRSGWMLRPILRYNTASKYPPRPCRMPACGMWNVSWADRAL